jgi:hypothetical protein
LDGAYFYWLAWIGWIITTFFFKKGQKRLFLSAFILIVIISSRIEIPVTDNVSIIFSAFGFLAAGYYFVSKQSLKSKWYLFLTTLIVTFAYVSFHLFELFDPVWLFADRKWLLSLAIVYVTLLLWKGISLRFFGMLIGVTQGEILYGYILQSFRFPYTIGSFAFLDAIAICSLLIGVWWVLEHLAVFYDSFTQKNAKEKQG